MNLAGEILPYLGKEKLIEIMKQKLVKRIATEQKESFYIKRKKTAGLKAKLPWKTNTEHDTKT